MNKELIGLVISFLALFIFLFSVSYMGSYWEAQTFNRLCHTNVTTWDAFTVQLRVDDCIK